MFPSCFALLAQSRAIAFQSLDSLPNSPTANTTSGVATGYYRERSMVTKPYGPLDDDDYGSDAHLDVLDLRMDL
jgi:hypothetical protein